MALSTISPNMSLVIPTVGQDPGPDWANNLNASLTIVDTHNHSAGSGVQITPSGLSINSDLTFQGNNLTASRSIRFQPQVTPLVGVADLGCIYESGVDLYYNDGSGNVIRITQSGGIAGTPGSIGGLVPPASVTYVSGTQTFVFQSAANTPANLDGGSVTLRNVTAGSFGVTLSAPVALGANYAISLPSALPPAQQIVTLDSSGNLSAPYTVDNSTIEVASNVIQVKTGGITDIQIANETILAGNIAPSTIDHTRLTPTNIVLTASSSVFTNSTSTPQVVTNFSTSFTATGGKTVIVGIVPDMVGAATAGIGVSLSQSVGASTLAGNFTASGFITVRRNGTPIATTFQNVSTYASITGPTTAVFATVCPPPSIIATDVGLAAGTYTYDITVRTSASPQTITVQSCKMIVYEMV